MRQMTGHDDDRPPFGVRVIQIGDRLIITRRWYSLFRMMAGPFGAAALWLGALGLGAPAPATRPASPAVVLLIAGALAAYVFLIGIVNRTRIVVDPYFLQITAGPLPSPAMRRLRAAALRRVTFRKKTTHVYTSVLSFCDIRGTLSDGSEILIDRIEWAEKKARWIHERLRRHLAGS
jgi:hypothetical protein